MDPLVSVVVTTKNEESNIENCLRSIKDQVYSNIEIIVVDNDSSDKTKELASRYTDKIFDKGPERSAQRNYGMLEKAAGEFLMFVDADMILSFDLVRTCVRIMENEKPAALHIPEVVLGTNFWSKVRRFERSFYDGTVIDGARFFSKEAFKAVNGFDETMSGPEDWYIDKKIKATGKIGLVRAGQEVFAPNWELYDFIKNRGVDPSNYRAVIFHNEAEFDLKRYLSKKGYYAKSFEGYINKWGKDDKDIKKQFGFSYRYFGVFLEDGKWKKIIRQPVLSLGMWFLRFLVGIKYLLR